MLLPPGDPASPSYWWHIVKDQGKPAGMSCLVGDGGAGQTEGGRREDPGLDQAVLGPGSRFFPSLSHALLLSLSQPPSYFTTNIYLTSGLQAALKFKTS